MMKALLVAVLCVALSIGSLADDPSVITLTTGQAKGVVGNKTLSFLGLPFAAPPVGPLRWKAPASPASWSGVREATWYGNTCLQHGDTWSLGTKQSEDCLYLNAYVPYPRRSEPVAAILFFYGGSWQFGSASFPLYNPEVDIGLTEDVAFITTNYRLGAFGFLAADALKTSDGGVGNYGLQDQRAALKWVIANADALGIDPKRITIMGESAGAGSVSNHLVSPLSKGLFSGAIMESGPFADWTAQTFNTSVHKYRQLATNLKCCHNATSCDDASPSVLACVNAKNGTEILDNTHGLASGVLEWSPVIDGVDVIAMPQDLAAQGKIADVPVMFGTNRDEGTLFTNAKPDLADTDYQTFLTTRYGDDLGNAVYNEYPLTGCPSKGGTSAYWCCSTALGDSQMVCPARRTGRWINAARKASGSTNGVYRYAYNHTLEVIKLFKPSLGCFHGSELAMVFDFSIALVSAEERELAKAFVKYWTTFAMTGSPNTPGLPAWPAFSPGNETTAVLDVNTILTPVNNFRPAECDWWDKHPVPSYLIWGS